MSEDVSWAIVETIADAEDIAPTEVDFALYDYVDPDALDQLAAQDHGDWWLTLELPDHDVTVSGDGTVSVASPE